MEKLQEMFVEVMPDNDSYLTGLSIVLGISTFGFEGLLLGPIVVILLKNLINIFEEQIGFVAKKI